MQKFSGLSLLRNGFSGHTKWTPQWRSASPKPAYDAVVIGGGGHGLGTAFHLAADHGLRNVAVLERGWIGGGNTGRNTTIIRSNYLFDESAKLYDHAVKLWETLSQTLNYNVMFSPRGVMMLAHTIHDVQVFKRHVHAEPRGRRGHEWLTPEEAKAFCPPLNIGPGMRYPILGAALHAAAARHGTTRWPGATPALPMRGVWISSRTARLPASLATRHPGHHGRADHARQYPYAEGGRGRGGAHIGRHGDGRAAAAARKLPAAGAGQRADQAGRAVRGHEQHDPRLHQPVRQGELVIGAGTDAYVSYSQRGGLHIAAHTLDAICEVFPMFRRMRMLRNWGGIVDLTPDRSPIIGKTAVPGLYVNCGWGTGGFKATPGSAHVFAHTMARDEPHPINAPFTLDRFRTGAMIDEAAAAAVAH